MASWRLIFLINLPVGVVATTWAYLALHEAAKSALKESVDLPGVILFSLFITALLVYDARKK